MLIRFLKLQGITKASIHKMAKNTSRCFYVYFLGITHCLVKGFPSIEASTDIEKKGRKEGRLWTLEWACHSSKTNIGFKDSKTSYMQHFNSLALKIWAPEHLFLTSQKLNLAAKALIAHSTLMSVRLYKIQKCFDKKNKISFKILQKPLKMWVIGRV